MKVIYADGVFEELVSLSFYIAEDSEKIAQRFLDSCFKTFLFLADNPGLGSLRRFENVQMTEIRMWRVKGFEKYLIFYQPLESSIKILHVFHSARDYNRVFEGE